jgi:hypothetical protein
VAAVAAKAMVDKARSFLNYFKQQDCGLDGRSSVLFNSNDSLIRTVCAKKSVILNDTI